MKQYIDKSALVAEIEKWLHQESILKKDYHDAYTFGLESVLKFLNTIEVKEVDLEKEINEHWDEWAKEDGFHSIDFAKHFFELGMQVSDKAQQGEEI